MLYSKKYPTAPKQYYYQSSLNLILFYILYILIGLTCLSDLTNLRVKGCVKNIRTCSLTVIERTKNIYYSIIISINKQLQRVGDNKYVPNIYNSGVVGWL